MQLVTYPPCQVIRRFVQTAEERAEEASKEAKASRESMAEVDDLDMVYTPEKYVLLKLNNPNFTKYT